MTLKQLENNPQEIDTVTVPGLSQPVNAGKAETFSLTSDTPIHTKVCDKNGREGKVIQQPRDEVIIAWDDSIKTDMFFWERDKDYLAQMVVIPPPSQPEKSSQIKFGLDKINRLEVKQLELSKLLEETTRELRREQQEREKVINAIALIQSDPELKAEVGELLGTASADAGLRDENTKLKQSLAEKKVALETAIADNKELQNKVRSFKRDIKEIDSLSAEVQSLRAENENYRERYEGIKAQGEETERWLHGSRQKANQISQEFQDFKKHIIPKSFPVDCFVEVAEEGKRVSRFRVSAYNFKTSNCIQARDEEGKLHQLNPLEVKRVEEDSFGMHPEWFGDMPHVVESSGQLKIDVETIEEAPAPEEYPDLESYKKAWDDWHSRNYYKDDEGLLQHSCAEDFWDNRTVETEAVAVPEDECTLQVDDIVQIHGGLVGQVIAIENPQSIVVRSPEGEKRYKNSELKWISTLKTPQKKEESGENVDYEAAAKDFIKGKRNFKNIGWEDVRRACGCTNKALLNMKFNAKTQAQRGFIEALPELIADYMRSHGTDDFAWILPSQVEEVKKLLGNPQFKRGERVFSLEDQQEWEVVKDEHEGWVGCKSPKTGVNANFHTSDLKSLEAAAA